MQGSINSSKESVLIDCGSAYNFITDTLIPKVVLPTNEIIPFEVEICNGDIIHCKRVCKDVLLQINDLQITQVFPFFTKGANVVLGIQHLATLNTVHAKWKMFLKFTINGNSYKLRGTPTDFQKPATVRHLTMNLSRVRHLNQVLFFLLPDLGQVNSPGRLHRYEPNPMLDVGQSGSE